MLDIRQSVNYANYLKLEGWTIERKDEINYFIRKFPVVGSVLKLQRPKTINYQFIDELVKRHKVFQLIVEPLNEIQANSLSQNGFKLSKSPYLPSKTLQIDLTHPINRLIGEMKKDARRAILKTRVSEGSRRERGSGQIIRSCSTPDEIIKWRKAWKNSVKFDRYVPSVGQLLNLRKSFPHNSSLFLASHNISGRIIGGALFTVSSHGISNYISYYWYGFTNNEGRSTLSQYSLLYQGILWAKKIGCKIFDFEGIYDPRFPNKSWLGFSHFKRSFGGYEVEYPGCYTRFIFPWS